VIAPLLFKGDAGRLKRGLVSGSNCRPSRNGVMGMGRSVSSGGSANGLSATDACIRAAVGDGISLSPTVLWLCPVGDSSDSSFCAQACVLLGRAHF
jgi:hypothetical protein